MAPLAGERHIRHGAAAPNLNAKRSGSGHVHRFVRHAVIVTAVDAHEPIAAAVADAAAPLMVAVVHAGVQEQGMVVVVGRQALPVVATAGPAGISLSAGPTADTFVGTRSNDKDTSSAVSVSTARESAARQPQTPHRSETAATVDGQQGRRQPPPHQTTPPTPESAGQEHRCARRPPTPRRQSSRHDPRDAQSRVGGHQRLQHDSLSGRNQSVPCARIVRQTRAQPQPRRDCATRQTAFIERAAVIASVATERVNPAHTSLTCFVCGARGQRETQAFSGARSAARTPTRMCKPRSTWTRQATLGCIPQLRMSPTAAGTAVTRC